MKTKILILLLAAFIFNACSKDKFQNKPVLKFKSVSTNDIKSGDEVIFNIEVSDKQGDLISDTVFYWKKVSFVSDSNNIDATAVPLPTDLPGIKKFDAEFQLMLINGSGYGSGTDISPATIRRINDSCVFKFWAKDLANNVSDTITSPPIIIQHS